MEPLFPGSKRALLYVGLLQFSISVTFAQLPSSARCQVSTSPVSVRAEGLTERLGDIVLQCSGSNPGTVFSGNFTLFLPVSITNRVDTGNLTRDAVLSVDLGSGFVPTAIAGQVSSNSISFNGISYTTPAERECRPQNFQRARGYEPAWVYVRGPGPSDRIPVEQPCGGSIASDSGLLAGRYVRLYVGGGHLVLRIAKPRYFRSSQPLRRGDSFLVHAG